MRISIRRFIKMANNGRTIHIRRRKAGVRYCSRITAEHRTISRSVWNKRLMDAMERVTTAKNRPGDIDDWTERTLARLNFANIWYKHKLRYGGYTHAEDFMAYTVMATI